MSLATLYTLLRAGGTAAVTAMAAVYQYYPHQLWIPAAIAAFAAVGFHVVPSVQQTSKPSQSASSQLPRS